MSDRFVGLPPTAHLLFLLLFASIFANLQEANGAEVMSSAAAPAPAPAPWELQSIMLFNETLLRRRRRLNSFQICALCTCCGGPKGLCLPSPCCYAISCNIPNRPFGFCAFKPKTCNCFGCHL